MFKFAAQYERDQVIEYEILPPVLRENFFLKVWNFPHLWYLSQENNIPFQFSSEKVL